MTLLQLFWTMFKAMALGRRPQGSMLDDRLLEYDHSLVGGAHAVLADETSRRRHAFSGGKLDLSIGLRRMMQLMPVMLRTQAAFSRSTEMARGPHNAAYAEDRSFADRIKRVATELGAEAVGFTDVTPDVIFADKSIPYRYAIVVARRMDKDIIATAPSLACMVEVQQTYGDLGILVNKLAARIIQEGYDAVPGPALGGAVDYPSLARKAGMGEYGRHGLLISPLNGSCQRLAAVLTNVVLPTDAVNEHGWIRDFCAMCGRCIRRCPVGAIREVPLPQPAGHQTCVIEKSCLDYFGSNYGCSVCIKECPFTTRGYVALKERMEEHVHPTAGDAA